MKKVSRLSHTILALALLATFWCTESYMQSTAYEIAASRTPGVMTSKIHATQDKSQEDAKNTTEPKTAINSGATVMPALRPTSNKIGQLEQISTATKVIWSFILVGQLLLILGVLAIFYKRGQV